MVNVQQLLPNLPNVIIPGITRRRLPIGITGLMLGIIAFVPRLVVCNETETESQSHRENLIERLVVCTRLVSTNHGGL